MGDLVIQYQDPEFDNELCNLNCMFELPKDKATLKVYTRAESHHTDSTLDTESLSSSSLEESSSGNQSCQMPQCCLFFWCAVKTETKKWSLPLRWNSSWHIKRHEIRHLGQVSRSHICPQPLPNTWRVWSCGPSSHQQAPLSEGTWRFYPWMVLLEVQFEVENGQLSAEAACAWLLQTQSQRMYLSQFSARFSRRKTPKWSWNGEISHGKWDGKKKDWLEANWWNDE